MIAAEGEQKASKALKEVSVMSIVLSDLIFLLNIQGKWHHLRVPRRPPAPLSPDPGHHQLWEELNHRVPNPHRAHVTVSRSIR